MAARAADAAYNPPVRYRILALGRATLCAAAMVAIAAPAMAQHAAFRIKGRLVSDRGEPIANADVRLEAFYGYGAGTFAGQRTLSAQTSAKGEWSVGAMQPGIW